MTAADVRRELEALSDPDKSAFFPRFFKCGKGEYGEGDVFLGVTVPQARSVAKQAGLLPLSEIRTLLDDEVHEVRLTGLFILVSRFEKGDEAERRRVVDFYLSNLTGVNNWDLVDCSAYKILGENLADGGDAEVLDRFAASGDLWKQRIAVVATLAFIRRGELSHTFRLAEALLGHRHDLMHKAVGWMLREAGKKDEGALRKFLDKHAAAMPRTMLRYAVERMGEGDRGRYMGKKKAS